MCTQLLGPAHQEFVDIQQSQPRGLMRIAVCTVRVRFLLGIALKGPVMPDDCARVEVGLQCLVRVVGAAVIVEIEARNSDELRVLDPFSEVACLVLHDAAQGQFDVRQNCRKAQAQGRHYHEALRHQRAVETLCNVRLDVGPCLPLHQHATLLACTRVCAVALRAREGLEKRLRGQCELHRDAFAGAELLRCPYGQSA